ncbi:MAG: hypothetical protein BWY31_03926 [Lentisphaerae bacterium ADurb.Bin242]|nr:MAG: hypothetical protein BWY31_03926 [Lentisphaerae bacterium ADurb.Bin242]
MSFLTKMQAAVLAKYFAPEYDMSTKNKDCLMSMKRSKDIFLQGRREEEKQPLRPEIDRSAYIHPTDRNPIN